MAAKVIRRPRSHRYAIYNWVAAAPDYGRPAMLDAHVGDGEGEEPEVVAEYHALLGPLKQRHTICVLHGAAVSVYLQGRSETLPGNLWRVGGSTPPERLWSEPGTVDVAAAREQWLRDMGTVHSYLVRNPAT